MNRLEGSDTLTALVEGAKVSRSLSVTVAATCGCCSWFPCTNAAAAAAPNRRGSTSTPTSSSVSLLPHCIVPAHCFWNLTTPPVHLLDSNPILPCRSTRLCQSTGPATSTMTLTRHSTRPLVRASCAPPARWRCSTRSTQHGAASWLQGVCVQQCACAGKLLKLMVGS